MVLAEPKLRVVGRTVPEKKITNLSERATKMEEAVCDQDMRMEDILEALCELDERLEAN